MDIHVLDAIAFVLLMFLIGYGIFEITQTNFSLRQIRNDMKKHDVYVDKFHKYQKTIIELLEKIIQNQKNNGLIN